MRKIKVLSLLGGFVFSMNALADSSGSALLPNWGAFYNGSSSKALGVTQVYVSNISAASVIVSVKLYDWAGNTVGDANFKPVVTNYGGLVNCNSTNTVCELNSNHSGYFLIGNNGSTAFSFVTGYGKVEWSSTTEQSAALLAHAMSVYEVSNSSSAYMKGNSGIPVNNGLPF